MKRIFLLLLFSLKKLTGKKQSKSISKLWESRPAEKGIHPAVKFSPVLVKSLN